MGLNHNVLPQSALRAGSLRPLLGFASAWNTITFLSSATTDRKFLV